MSTLPGIVEVEGTAALSSDGRYRWWLRRVWSDGPRVAWIMLNPSTADADQDDPTIRRVIGFSKQWGYGAADVVNLFAYRATDPKELKAVDDPVGEFNDAYLAGVMRGAVTVVCAWGSTGDYATRYFRRNRVRELAEATGHELLCLGVTKSGDPKHPLYIPYSTNLQPWVSDGGEGRP